MKPSALAIAARTAILFIAMLAATVPCMAADAAPASADEHAGALAELERMGAQVIKRDAGDGVGTLMISTDGAWSGGDDGLSLFGKVRGLYKLRLGGRITDAGLVHIGALPGLTSLDVHVFNITDEGIGHLRPLAGLQRLNLTYTRVTDAGLEHLAGMTSLKWLGLSYTPVTRAGVDKLKQSLTTTIIEGNYQ